MLSGSQVTEVMIKDTENSLLQKKYEIALKALEEISKSTSEPMPWITTPTSDSRIASKALERIANVGKIKEDSSL